MALLEAHELNVRFGLHHAVRDVSVDVEHGSIVGLIGPNGAGKTTTFNALSGVQACTGRVFLDGDDVSNLPVHRRAWMGLHRTFQRLEVFGSMTAFDNIRVAAEIAARYSTRSRKAAPAVAREVVDRLGLGRVANRRADALPTGQARLVELGRVLAAKPRVVLLDEPASGLDEGESDSFAQLLIDLAAEGMAILLVEHDVHLVMRVCADIYVLDFGAILAQGSPAEIQANQSVLDAYLGSAVEE
jgi:branched-chain amino acid transport system ATP-binding protein